MTDLSVSNNWKSNNYNSILVIIYYLTEIVHYKPFKVTIDIFGLIKIIINVVIQHYGFPNFGINNCRANFFLKFWFWLCYFFDIMWLFSIAFYRQTNKQIVWQNSIIEEYLYVFMNWKQNNWVKFLSMIKCIYNNFKNKNICHMLFEFNCDYYSYISFKNKCNIHSKSSLANGLAMKLKKTDKYLLPNLFLYLRSLKTSI